jgi:thioredoxin reductase
MGGLRAAVLLIGHVGTAGAVGIMGANAAAGSPEPEAGAGLSVEPIVHDRCVIGAGPAGLQLGFFFEQQRRDYVILERAGTVGSYFRKYPRHRQLISINKRNTGHEDDEPKRSPEFDLRHDWNSLVNGEEDGGRSLLFTNYSKKLLPPADRLVDYLEDFAALYNLKIDFMQNVKMVTRAPGGERLLLDTSSGQRYSCRVVIAATGLHVPYVPNIKGIEHTESYEDMSVDPEDFEGHSVLVLGNGNAAMETASNLMDVANYIHIASKSQIKLTIETHYVGDVRLTAQVGSVIEGYQLKSLNGLLERKFERMEDMIYFEKDEKGRVSIRAYDNSSNAYHTFVAPVDRSYDRVLRCLGWTLDRSFFAKETMPNMMPLAPGGASTTDSAGAQVVEVDDMEVLVSGHIEYKMNGKWKKRWAQLASSNSTGAELQIFRRKPPQSSMSADDMTAKQRAALRPQKTVSVNSVRLSEAERSLGCVDHQNCAEFARKLQLVLPGPQCKVNAKTLFPPSPDMLLGELCPRSCNECARLQFSVADSLRAGDGEHWITAPSDEELIRWADALKDVVRTFGSADQDLAMKVQGQATSLKYPDITSEFESRNVPGLFFAGTVAHGPDWRKAAGGFIHGFRYTAKALARILNSKLDGVDWPSSYVQLDAASVIEHVRERINHASSLYQMVGHIGDVIVFPAPADEVQDEVEYFADIPVSYAREHVVPKDRASLFITFEYGPKNPGLERPSSSMPGRDVFRQARTPFAPGNGDWVGVSEFLHPVFRFHFPESLENKTRSPRFVSPGEPRAFDVKHSSWATNLWIDPFFRSWWQTKPSYDALASVYNESLPDAMRTIEYHMVEDFNTDWTAAKKWTGFYEFLLHCVRDLHLLLNDKEPEWAVHQRGVVLDDGKPGFW